MARCRVFQNPDGSLLVMYLNESRRLAGETDAQFFLREQAKQPALVALPFIDTDTSNVPTDRAQRHKWRIAGGQLIVDLAVPNPPHPKQALLDEIDAANSVAQLRAALRRAATS